MAIIPTTIAAISRSMVVKDSDFFVSEALLAGLLWADLLVLDDLSGPDALLMSVSQGLQHKPGDSLSMTARLRGEGA